MSVRKLRIAVSIWMFKPGTGGLQAHTESLCRELMKRGHEVVVVTRAYSRVPVFLEYLYFNEPSGDVVINGVNVRPLRFSPAWRPVQWLLSKFVHRRFLSVIGLWLYRLQARRAAREAFEGFDLIHHIGQADALIGFATADAARRAGVPFLVQPTCHPYQAGDSPIDHRLFRLADGLMVHTEYERDYFICRRYRMPIYVVGNGIMDRSDGIGERFRKNYGVTGPFILFIGRKSRDKGYPRLVEAFKEVRARCPEVSLICMGPREQESTAGEKGDGIVELDYVPESDKHDALAACMMLCVPSEGESFGLVYMEAGRYGKPVVARSLPVLQELLEDGLGGLLLGKADPVHRQVDLGASELAEGLIGLIQDEGSRLKLGEKCREISASHVWNEVVKRFENAYLGMIR
jgi:glycosyltransferase involved in cell wall biosynthesis